MASFMWIMMLLQRSQGTTRNLNRNWDSDNDVTSEDEEEDNNSYDENVITVTEASNMAQHLPHCRVINKDVLEGIVVGTERLHEFNEKSQLNWLHRKRLPTLL
jgi:hypothetical protein